jgi:linoleate 10R-lipoxygenase
VFCSDSSAQYLTEDLGIDPPFAGTYRVAKQDESINSLNVKQGERLFLNVAAANMNVS